MLHQTEEFSRAVVALTKQARLEMGWSRATLAEKAGLSRTGVTMVENRDRHRPSTSATPWRRPSAEISRSFLTEGTHPRI